MGDEREVAKCERLFNPPSSSLSTDHTIEPHDIEGLPLSTLPDKVRGVGFMLDDMCEEVGKLKWRRGWIIDIDLNGGVGALWWTSGGVPQHGLTFNLIDEMELAYA